MGNIAWVYCTFVFQTTYERPDGTRFLHIVKECPRDYHLAFILKKGSPFQPLMNDVLRTFLEAGKFVFVYSIILHLFWIRYF